MQYFINGDQVSEATFDREANDNFNLDIAFTISESATETHMTYKEDK